MAIDPVFAGAKFVHVALAASWLGLVAVHALIVLPLLRASTAPTRREFAGRFMAAAIRWGNLLGGLTFVSGLFLAYVAAGNLRFEGEWGSFVAFGLVVNLAVLYLINVVVARSWRAVQALTERERPDIPPPARAVFMEKRMAVNLWLCLLLLAFAAFSMVLAGVTGRP